MSSLRLHRALFPAVVAACAVSPALAAADQGWFLALDLAFAQPALEQEYAVQIDSSVAPVETTRHVMDGDSDAAYRFGFGYSFGPERGDLRVTYWSFDGNDSEERRMDGFVEPLIFGEGYYGAYYYLYDAAGVATETTTEVTAVTVDLDYARAVTHGRRFRLSWLAGLRYAGFEETRAFHGDDTILRIDQEKVIDADAIGVRAGAEAEYGFGRVFTITGKASFSLLQSTSDATTGQEIHDSAGGALLAAETATSSSDSRNGSIIDASLAGVWRLGRADVVLGIEVSQWNGLVEDPIPAEEAGSRDTISFTSAYVGLRYWFKDRAPGSAVP